MNHKPIETDIFKQNYKVQFIFIQFWLHHVSIVEKCMLQKSTNRSICFPLSAVTHTHTPQTETSNGLHKWSRLEVRNHNDIAIKYRKIFQNMFMYALWRQLLVVLPQLMERSICIMVSSIHSLVNRVRTQTATQSWYEYLLDCHKLNGY